MKPKILIGIETLLPGGAELFAIRLANSLSFKYDITLFVVFGDRIESRLIHGKKNNFKLEFFNHPLKFFITKLDGLLFRLRIDFSLRNLLVKNFLWNLIEKEKFDILHSNQFKVDYLFFNANQEFQIPQITTIHGDYINFHEQLKGGKLRVLNFEWKAKSTLTALNGIVYISDHQIIFLRDVLSIAELEKKSRKIYNGFELEPDSILEKQSENQDSIFTFGMVARGIPEKGWEIAIQAFLQLDRTDTRLILVGESEYLNQLKTTYRDNRILFAGYSVNPLEWIEKFDVGLLPTTFSSESLPTSIIEYLAMGKPVIASDKGEIGRMLEQKGAYAGILLKVKNDAIEQSDLSAAMKQLVDNKAMYNEMKGHAKSHAGAFSMKKCIESYIEFYEALQVTTKL
jgi:glycosyltransferase involved in cell wall biosynthesis